MDRQEYICKSTIRLLQPNKPSKPFKPSKLLLLLLKRITNSKLRSHLISLMNYSVAYGRRMARLSRISSINAQACLTIAFQRIRVYSLKKTAALRTCLRIGNRVSDKYVGFAWKKLDIWKAVQLRECNAKDRLDRIGVNILMRWVKKFIIKNKRNGWDKLKFSKSALKKTNRLISINTIFRNSQKRSLLQSWIKLLQSTKQKIQIEKVTEQQDFSIQLQDMRIQIENKNQHISRLQEQIFQLKQGSTFRQNQLFQNSMYYNRSASYLSKSRSKYSYVDFDSNSGSLSRNPSYGSILGRSILSKNSKKSQPQTCCCQTCTYRQKYQLSKTGTETLKKQLQIIKVQLQFSKDMNQHMQNEIRTYLNNDQFQNRISKLGMQLKQCQRDRDNLKEKIYKYQKYVAKLKLEFKAKIEDIYRKVRKNQ